MIIIEEEKKRKKMYYDIQNTGYFLQLLIIIMCQGSYIILQKKTKLYEIIINIIKRRKI